MKEKINKEEIKKELLQIDEKMKLEKIQRENSSEYKSLITTIKGLYSKEEEVGMELRKLEKEVYVKYIDNYWGYGFKSRDIKSFVKQGIKKGLGITSVAFINEYDLRKIVKELFNKDLKEIKPQTDKLIDKIKEIDKLIKKEKDNKEKLMVGLNFLIKQRKKIEDRLYEEENIKNKKIGQKKEEVSIQINKNLPKFMDKIIKEVNRRLILENLK